MNRSGATGASRADAPLGARTFFALFRGFLIVFPDIGDSPGRPANRPVSRPPHSTRETAIIQAKERDKSIALHQTDATGSAGARERWSLLPLFTTSFKDAINRHTTPSTSKLKVDEPLRPAAVRRSSTTVPNPEIRVAFTGGPPCSRHVIWKLGSVPLSSICQTRETRPSSFESAPCLRALSHSSCKARPSVCVALGLSRTIGPSPRNCFCREEDTGAACARTRASSGTPRQFRSVSKSWLVASPSNRSEYRT